MNQSTWHILRVPPGKERAVKDAALNAPIYFPVRQVKRFNRRYRSWFSYAEPLFPGYVFVHTEEPQALRLKMAGIRRWYLRNGDKSYALLNDDQMKQLKSIEISANEEIEATPHSFVVGSRVRFISGSLEGLMAVVTAIREGSDDLQVSIDGSFPVKVSTYASRLEELVA